MIMGPITQEILESIRTFGERARKEAERLKTGCPQCGRLVMKKELEKRGCYLCGWKPTDETTKPGADETTKAGARGGRPRPYRTRCTRCGTMAVTKQLLEKGCYVCGLEPIALESDFGPTGEELERAGLEEAERRLEEALRKELDAQVG